MGQSRIGLVSAGLMGITLAACAVGLPAHVSTYGPEDYSEKQVEPGIWLVTGHSSGLSPRDFGRNAAVYRAAEIVSRQGYTHVQVLDQKGAEMRLRYGGSNGETLILTVRGSDSPDRPLDCRSDKPDDCFTFNAGQAMTRLAGSLGKLR